MDGTLLECQNLAAVLNQYCFATGQAVNLNKLGVSFRSGCPINLQRNLAQQLRVPIIDKTGNYLGIPTDWGKSKKEMFAWILARVNMKIVGWKEKFLSNAGKETLIKSVVQALPQYAMSIFKIPMSICISIERRIATFWWKQNENSNGLHWKKWEALKKRKDEGGIGFRDLVNFNKAMLGKQAWRLSQSSTALWSRIFKGVYFPNGDMWKAGKGQRPSWGWQSIMVGRETIEKEIQWRVGDGKKISIWEDKWLESGVIGGPANRDEPTTIAELINDTDRRWKEAEVQHLFENRIANEILSILLSPIPEEDALVW